jgi:hypothetical protein
MLIVYQGSDEILVCKRKDEVKLLEDWFGKGTCRDINDYDRLETKGVVQISSHLDCFID